MRLLRLSLTGFRNYERFSCDFAPGVNLILGRNAQGKTNLLEAVGYLSAGYAFRTRKEAELIRFGADFAELTAEVSSYGREQSLRAVLFAGRRPRQLFLNEVKKPTWEDLGGVLHTVLFCPEDLLVLKKGAAERRRLMNDALCQLRPRYATALEEYGRLYRQKSAVLKDRWERPDLLRVLPEYNERMAQVGAILISLRARYLRALGEAARAHHDAFTGGREEITLVYHTVGTVEDPFVPLPELCERLREHQRTHERAELESAQCLSGPHKDDFEVLLSELSVKTYGSQGQTRTAAISLKLAERDLMARDTGELPVLLLDDVLSELDAGRQDFLVNRIREGQVFITSCDTDRLSEAGKLVRIEAGRIIEN